ncbi:MAG: hypothetical protein J6J11_02155 [Treponema sp.]|nr:hypothetical protein [Treponema sp.]
MINYNKNKLINQALDKYYDTFAHMLDTTEYVPQSYNDKIGKYIFKNMKRHFKLINKEDRKFQRKFKKELKAKKKKEKPVKSKWSLFRLFKRKKQTTQRERSTD